MFLVIRVFSFPTKKFPGLWFHLFKHNNTFWLSLLKLGWWFEKTASLTRLLHLQFSQALVSGFWFI
ncbi:unnamed protein product [Brassica oleracea]